MKTVTKQYSMVCPSCNSVGFIPNNKISTTSITRICPACHGSGVVIVTETITKKMKTSIVKISELKKGDIFSFKTIMTPIWWRFISFNQGIISYEEIKNNFEHTETTYEYVLVKVKLK